MAQQRRMGGQPMFILSEDSQRTQGRDAQSSNIMAGKAVAESVRTTLGPRGMDKMLVDSGGDVVITNDGATILNEMDIEHPAAQMIVEVADSQEEEVGDGTTTAAVLAGNLLGEAEDLIEQDVHATTIVEGYHEAAEIALEAIAEQVNEADVDDEILRQVAESSMTGKGTGGLTAESLAETVVEAIRHVATDDDVARDNVTVHTQVGASSNATELVPGIIVDEEPAHDGMPSEVEDASIAVLDVELDVRTGDVDAEYAIDSIDQLNAAIDAEEGELQGYAETVADSGADVVFTTEDVADRVATALANEGILVFEGLGDSDARQVASATGARRVGDLEDLETDDFGSADRIHTEAFGGDDLAFVEGGAAAETVTVFVRGGTEHVVDELERAIGDALDVVATALESGEVVPGAGATEIAIADKIREEAAGIEGRKQLAVTAFADAVDIVPRTLASNTGRDPIDALVDLRAAHESEGRAGLITNGDEVTIDDPFEHGVVDPADVKREAVESATEAATMIVRIDDVIAAE
ncbi:thermosome [Natrinema salaciae]|uniref:Thermosome n=2 Tax=Natrinema salaciae TaxID=1186196 RepID=A0A1H9QL04_9EURY|nr:thermosome [Natrinema salaciae]